MDNEIRELQVTHSDSDSDKEEALSFCDLPIREENDDDSYDCLRFSKTRRKRNTLDQEFFEFASFRNPEPILSAEDIIVGGKLLPCKSLPIDTKFKINFHEQSDFKHKSNVVRGSDSFSELQRSYSCIKSRQLRSNCSIDHRKLRRASSSSKIVREKQEARETRRTSSAPATSERTSTRKGEFSFPVLPPPAKPRWPLLLSGLMKGPPEMELKDIRNRQNRRIPPSMFPNFGGLQTVSVKRDGGKGSWKFFRALSCKDHADVVVTTSLGCIPHV